MHEFFESIMPNVIPKLPALWNATLETLAMTGISALYILVIGMALGILLTVTKKGGLLENALVYRVLDIIINLLRSVPFIILLFLLIPLGYCLYCSLWRCDYMDFTRYVDAYHQRYLHRSCRFDFPAHRRNCSVLLPSG